MFTGIIEEIGEIVSKVAQGDGFRIVIKAHTVLEGTVPGDSISVNGICFTVVQIENNTFALEAVKETVEKSALADLRSGSFVNLERALRAESRLGGHFVQGHVDGVGTVKALRPQNIGSILTIETTDEIGKYIVPKGSIAVNGTSLTVAEKDGTTFSIALIPHTIENTVLRALRPGDKVNLEVDIIGKYVYEFLKNREGQGITKEKLAEFGF